MTQKLKRQFKNICKAWRGKSSAVLSLVKNKKYSFKIKNIFSKNFSRRAGALAVLVLFLIANFFQNSIQTQGAQFTFFQTDWAGGVTANNAVHPTNENNWNEYSAGTNVLTSVSGQATLSETAHTTYPETFTGTVYKDAVNTTADWNTSSGQVQMSTEAAGVNLYSKLNGILAGSNIVAQVKAGDDYYFGSNTGKFLKYNSVTDTATDLSSKASFLNILSLAFDSVNNVVYVGTFAGGFFRYNTSSYSGGGTYPTADTAYTLTAKVSGATLINGNMIYAMAIDSASGVLYLGSVSNRFVRYNTTSYTSGGTYPTADTAYDLRAKISGWFFNSAVTTLTLDTVNHVVYIGSTAALNGRYNEPAYSGGGTYPDADTGYDFSAALSYLATYSIVIDDANRVVYFSGGSGKLWRYNMASYVAGGTYSGTDTFFNLSAKTTFGTSGVIGLALDSANNVLYLAGQSGKMARYNTTFNDGLNGTYPTADTGYSLTAKISSFWSTNNALSLAFDSASSVVYVFGNAGKFARYNTTSYSAGGTYPTADTAYDLTSKVNGASFNGNTINNMAEGNNNEIYLVGAAGRFAKYDTQTGVATDLSDKIYSFVSTTNLSMVVFDGVNNVVYLGGGAYFLRYNPSSYIGGGTYPTANTAYNLTSKISGFWGSTAQIFVSSIDSANGVLYAAGEGGRFFRYNVTSYSAGGAYPTANTAYNLTTKVSSIFASNIMGLALDSSNGVLYMLGWAGVLGRYNTTFNNGLDATYPTADTAYDITAKISSFWSTNYLQGVAFDSVNNVLYIGGNGGKFARYNTTSYSGGGVYPTADTAYDFSAKLSSFWQSQVVTSIALDSASGTMYIGGGAAKFARYSVGADVATNLRSPDSIPFLSQQINSLILRSNGYVYIGANLGYFAEKPASASFSSAQSITLDAVSYNIAYATLTKNDTIGTGTIVYQLSNNGGSTWETFTPSVTKVFSSVGSDLRFKITVSGNATVQDINIAYWAYNPTGELTSSKYNASDPANVMAKIAWSETLPSGTDIKFQLRTSADGNSWTAWCGPDDGVGGSCNSGTYFTSPTGTETVDDINNDHTNDQWYQYKVFLSTTDGVNTPTLSDATVTYVVNAPPQVQSVTASQGSDGLVTVNYQVLDPDTNTGVTPQDVNVTLQYCTANCSSAGSETWADATAGALSGDFGAGVSVIQGDWTSHQLVWTPTTDYNNQYNTSNFKVRIKAYDGELANHTAYGESGVFILDTNKPTLNATTLLINNSSSAVQPQTSALTLKLQNLSGDTAPEQIYAQFSRDGGTTWYGANGDDTLATAGSWGTGFALNTASARSWPWTMASRSETITVRIKDAYNNIQTTTDANSVQYNATPEIQSTSASQGTDGLVTVDFEVKDPDTTLGVTPNALNLTLQYCTANCSNVGGETWTDAVTATGDGAGISVTGGSWTAHQIVWTAKTDYANRYNATNFKVRVKADDSDPVNNLVYGNSGTFVLDTQDPVAGSFTINHSTNILRINSASDDGNWELYVGTSAATLFDAGNKTSPLLNQSSSYPNDYVYNSMTADPATIYVGVKDAKGNTSYTQNTTPLRPTNLVYYDISNNSNGEYREFVAWSVITEPAGGFASYKVYRSTSENGTYSLLATVTDRLTNYYLDKVKDNDPLTIDSDESFDPLNPTTYFYKVVSADDGGNISAFSATVNDAPDGQGGSDTTAPTISNVQVSNIDTTSAVITWSTDELSNSLVGYSPDYAYTPERGLSSYEMANHRIALTGLLPNTTYHINVQSEDARGNTGIVCYDPLNENLNIDCSPGDNVPEVFTFTTDPGPAISSVAVSSNNTQATVSWVTSIDSDTYVVYSDEVSAGALVNPMEVGTPDRVGGGALFNHSQILTTYNNLPLISGTTYFFYVKSTDATHQTAIDNNGGNFYSFTTTQDDDAPVIASNSISAVIINDNKAAINWVTDEAATSMISYGTAPGGPYTNTESVLTYDKSHYVILKNLSPYQTYYYTVTSADINTNSVTSEENSFETLMNPEQQHLPLSAITAVVGSVTYDLTSAESVAAFKPAVLTDTSSVIEFTTDQIAMCDIQYKKDGQDYNPSDFIIEETGYNINHSMHIMNLILNTKYFYKIECVDNLPEGQAGLINSEEFSFTTLEKQYGQTEAEGLGDAVAPTISGVSTSVTSGESVTITWDTDEIASSYIQHGIVSGTYTDMAGDPLINFDKTLYDTTHTVIVNGLIPGIKYYFTAISHDQAGNIATSAESTFTTGTSSSLSSINITSAALGEALITWTTSEKTSSLVEYGITNLYGQKKEDTATVTAHSMTINGLTAAQLYHLRVGGKDANGQRYSSGDYTFTPKSPPQIGNVTIKDVTEHGATVSFPTDFPTDFTVTYTSLSSSADSGSKGKPDYAVSHEVILDNLKPGTTYSLKIKASDEQGNSVEKIAQNFTTGKDENAPEITKARTESALAQTDKVQTIISWETNELSTCSLIYREGAGGDEKEYKVNDRAAVTHVAVVTTFKPGTVYYFKIKSTDEAGNESISSEYALLTPQKKENIVQIIVNNFQDIFSWVNKV
jgi:hypothetical protein